MSDIPFQLPISKGTDDPFSQVIRKPVKFTLQGIGSDTPEGRAAIEQYQGAVRQFYQQQAQNSSLGVINYHQVTADLGPGVKATYTRNYDQEVVQLHVQPAIPPKPEKGANVTDFDLDLGGYIAVDWSPSGAGETMAFNLNGKQVGVFAFPGFSILETGVVLIKFGGDALKHHSYADAHNPLNGHLIQNPIPEAKELPQYWVYDENAYPPDSKGFRISVSNYIGHGGTATGSFTPPIVDTIQLDPSLLIKGQNLFTVTIVSESVFVGSGIVYAEFYSRKARIVQQGWKESMAPNKQIFINDKPLKFAADVSDAHDGLTTNTFGTDADPTGKGLLIDLSK